AFVQTAVLAATPDANVLTGTTLAPNVINSSLTSVGTLSNLSVSGNISSGGTITGTNGLNASASSSGNGIGYTSGGKTVNQNGNKRNSVTINGYSGQITMAGSKLNSGSSVSFDVKNSVVSNTDVPFVVIASNANTGTYRVAVEAVDNGQFTITLYNDSGSQVSDNVVLNFIIFKGN
ncbi:MAG: hypothetical protein KGO92_14155, partial [Bacteroidota bacterium]|nr:hypothetical protein [Bacteroidota bacterium]